MDLNDLHVANLLANWPITALYLTTAAGACWHWWRRGYVAAIATLFVTSALISQSRLVREWYCLPLIPLFVLAIGENNSRSYLKDLVVVLIMFTVISSLAFHNSIFELRLFKEIFEAIKRVS